MTSTCTSVDLLAGQIGNERGGTVARADLLALSTRATVDGWVARRRIVPRFKGAYVINGAPGSLVQDLWAAVQSFPRGAIVSHFSVLLLLGFPHVPDRRIHILSYERLGRSRCRGIVGHRTRLDTGNFAVIGPHDLPCTSVARAIIDCSCTPEGARLTSMWIDYAIRERLCTLEDLRDARQHVRRGPRRDLRCFDQQMRRREADHEVGDSQPEERIADWLERAGLGRPRLRSKVKVPGRRRPLRPDGLYPDLRVGFEYQSWHFHGRGQVEPFHRDKQRLNLLRREGYDMYEFTSTSTRDEVVATIGAALRRARARLST